MPNHLAPYLFAFRAHGLPECSLALMVSEVVTVTELNGISAVPIAAPMIYGLCYWQSRLITVLDLAAALRGEAASLTLHPDQRMLVASVPIQGRIEHLAWPVDGAASMINIPAEAYRSTVPASLHMEMIEDAICIGEEDVIILNLTGLYH